MEKYAAAWLMTHFGLWTLPLLVLAHVLRQGVEISGATAFSMHRDDEDNHLIAFSVIVKLTDDKVGSPASQMRLLKDAGILFHYKRKAGSAAVFRAGEVHSSVELPKHHTGEVLKLALFFRTGFHGTRSGNIERH